MNKKYLILIAFVLILLLPQSVKADVSFYSMMPLPFNHIFSFIWNAFIILALIAILKLEGINKRNILTMIILVFIVGAISDWVSFTASGLNLYSAKGSLLFFELSFIMIFVFNTILAKFILKLNAKKSIIFGILMGFLTNPIFGYDILFVLLAGFLGLLAFIFACIYLKKRDSGIHSVVLVLFIITLLFSVFTFYAIIDSENRIRVRSMDLTQQAHDEISRAFRQTENNLALWPERYDLLAGQALITSAGVKNNDPQKRDLYFVITVKCAGTNASGGNCNNPNQWEILYTNTSISVKHGEVGFRDIIFSALPNTPYGDYIFDVMACYSESSSITTNDCSASNLWAQPQRITFTVVS